MARNCRFPVVGPPGSQPGNPGLALQATADSQSLELLVPNLGTIGYHFKELPVPKSWNSPFPTWEPQVTTARNCWFPGVGTPGCQRGDHSVPLQGTGTDSSQPWNHGYRFPKVGTHDNPRLPLQGTAGAQRLELVPSLGLPLQATACSHVET